MVSVWAENCVIELRTIVGRSCGGCGGWMWGARDRLGSGNGLTTCSDASCLLLVYLLCSPSIGWRKTFCCCLFGRQDRRCI